MGKGGRRRFQGAIEQQLPRGGDQQVRAPHHFGDSHGGVIHHHRQLIGGQIIVPPNHKIAEILPGLEFLTSEKAVLKTNRLALRHKKPPVA